MPVTKKAPWSMVRALPLPFHQLAPLNAYVTKNAPLEHDACPKFCLARFRQSAHHIEQQEPAARHYHKHCRILETEPAVTFCARMVDCSGLICVLSCVKLCVRVRASCMRTCVRAWGGGRRDQKVSRFP